MIKEPCLHCGQTAMPKYAKQRYCGDRCRKAAHYQRNRSLKKRVNDQCLQCGDSMEGKRADAKWCSSVCRSRHRFPPLVTKPKRIVEQTGNDAELVSAMRNLADKLEAQPEPKLSFNERWERAYANGGGIENLMKRAAVEKRAHQSMDDMQAICEKVYADLGHTIPKRGRRPKVVSA